MVDTHELVRPAHPQPLHGGGADGVGLDPGVGHRAARPTRPSATSSSRALSPVDSVTMLTAVRRSATTSTSTPPSTTPPTSAGCSAPTRSRCCPTGRTCRSATTGAPARSSCRAPTSSARAASGRRRRTTLPTYGPSPRLDIEAELGFVVGVPSRARRAGDHRRLRAPHLRRRRPQRLVRARHPGVGVRPARPVPRQVLRDLHQRLGDPAGRPRGGLDRPARPGRPGGRSTTSASTVPAGLDIEVEVVLDGEVVVPAALPRRCTGRRRRCSPTPRSTAPACAPATCGARAPISGPEPRPARLPARAVAGAARSPSRPADASATFLEDGDEVTLRYSAPGTVRRSHHARRGHRTDRAGSLRAPGSPPGLAPREAARPVRRPPARRSRTSPTRTCIGGGRLHYGVIDNDANLRPHPRPAGGRAPASAGAGLHRRPGRPGEPDGVRHASARSSSRSPRRWARSSSGRWATTTSAHAYARGLFDSDDDGAARTGCTRSTGCGSSRSTPASPATTTASCSAEQLAWLADVLATPAEHGTLLAMHHPPLPLPMLRAAELIELHDQQAPRRRDRRAPTCAASSPATCTSRPGRRSPASRSRSPSASCYTIDPAPVDRFVSGVDAGAGLHDGPHLRRPPGAHPRAARARHRGEPRRRWTSPRRSRACSVEEARELASSKTSPFNDCQRPPRQRPLHSCMRHGQTHANVSGELDTAHPGLDLTDLGRAQATTAAQALAGEQLDAIYVSSRVRTHQTAAPTAEAAIVDAGARSTGWRRSTPATSRCATTTTRSPATSTPSPPGSRATSTAGCRAARPATSSSPATTPPSRSIRRRRPPTLRWSSATVPALRTWASIAHGCPTRAPRPPPSRSTTPPSIVLEGDPDAGWELVSWQASEPFGGDFLDVDGLDRRGARADPDGDDVRTRRPRRAVRRRPWTATDAGLAETHGRTLRRGRRHSTAVVVRRDPTSRRQRSDALRADARVDEGLAGPHLLDRSRVHAGEVGQPAASVAQDLHDPRAPRRGTAPTARA